MAVIAFGAEALKISRFLLMIPKCSIVIKVR